MWADALTHEHGNVYGQPAVSKNTKVNIVKYALLANPPCVEEDSNGPQSGLIMLMQTPIVVCHLNVCAPAVAFLSPEKVLGLPHSCEPPQHGETIGVRVARDVRGHGHMARAL